MDLLYNAQYHIIRFSPFITGQSRLLACMGKSAQIFAFCFLWTDCFFFSFFVQKASRHPFLALIKVNWQARCLFDGLVTITIVIPWHTLNMTWYFWCYHWLLWLPAQRFLANTTDWSHTCLAVFYSSTPGDKFHVVVPFAIKITLVQNICFILNKLL